MNDADLILKIKTALQSLSVEFVKVKPWNEKKFKIEISSNVFSEMRRLDRFELLNAHLKEKLPEVFANYTFLYKPFTKEEWEVRNQRKLEN